MSGHRHEAPDDCRPTDDRVEELENAIEAAEVALRDLPESGLVDIVDFALVELRKQAEASPNLLDPSERKRLADALQAMRSSELVVLHGDRLQAAIRDLTGVL